MHQWRIYLERADTDEERSLLGDNIWADTMGDALQKASEYWEVPSHDLIAIQVIPERK